MNTVHLTHYRACIIEAARAGNPPRVIAEEMGTTPGTVKVILAEARAQGIEIPRFTRSGIRSAGVQQRAGATK
jgi:predicted transcriptional regulator